VLNGNGTRDEAVRSDSDTGSSPIAADRQRVVDQLLGAPTSAFAGSASGSSVALDGAAAAAAGQSGAQSGSVPNGATATNAAQNGGLPQPALLNSSDPFTEDEDIYRARWGWQVFSLAEKQGMFQDNQTATR
jgi:hypothetical protein